MEEKLVSITPKFQIHIPLSVRKVLKIDKPIKAKISVTENSKILIEPIKESKLMELAGTVKTQTKIDIDNIRDKVDFQEV